MIVIPVALVACNTMNAARISTVPVRLNGDSPDVAAAGALAGAAATAPAEALRCAIMRAVVATLRTATAAIASRMAWLPYQPMMKVASGGPATHATDTIARVLTMSAGRAPEWRRWA